MQWGPGSGCNSGWTSFNLHVADYGPGTVSLRVHCNYTQSIVDTIVKSGDRFNKHFPMYCPNIEWEMRNLDKEHNATVWLSVGVNFPPVLP